MSRRFMRQFGAPGVIYEAGYGIVFDFGNTLPVNGSVGYAPGCIFIVTNGAAGSQLYLNEGTHDSSLFNVVGFGATGLTATAAEINRNVHVATRLITLAGSTSITLALHEGKTCLLTGTGSAFTQTLPLATGSGARFRFVVGAVNTSNHVILCAGSDIFNGELASNSTAASPDLNSIWIATTATTCTLNGTTTGGAQIGDWVEVEDILSAKWAVRGCTTSTTAATPFS